MTEIERAPGTVKLLTHARPEGEPEIVVPGEYRAITRHRTRHAGMVERIDSKLGSVRHLYSLDHPEVLADPHAFVYAMPERSARGPLARSDAGERSLDPLALALDGRHEPREPRARRCSPLAR